MEKVAAPQNGAAAVPAADPAPRSTAGLISAEDWRGFFAVHSEIVLVANSDAVDIGALRAGMSGGALFVFFNKVYKVLDRPFDGHALLVARSGMTGANIAYRREVGEVLKFFPSARFAGVMNMMSGETEIFSPAGDFEGAPVGHLDLTGYFADFYTPGHRPSSGFALAVWLCEHVPEARVVLAGFSAQRSERWKLFHIHDWTFEQIVQRVLVRAGRLAIAGDVPQASYAAVTGRFPGISPADVSMAAAEVLSERLEGTNREIDRLISVTRFGRAVDGFLRRLKPRSRKQKLKEERMRLAKKGGSE